MEETIRKVLTDHGKLTVDAMTVSSEENLYICGLTSHACVNVMLGLEDAYDFEFPDRLLRKSTFESVQAIRDALAEAGVASTI